MPRRNIRKIDVLINATLVGILEIETDELSPIEHVSFTYAGTWLSDPASFEISPELLLVRGPQRPTMGRRLFGSFQDATPDAWGQKLLFEEVRQQARGKGGGMPTVGEVAYLLMVNDETRQGALRFKEHGQFLSSWRSFQRHRTSGIRSCGKWWRSNFSRGQESVYRNHDS